MFSFHSVLWTRTFSCMCWAVNSCLCTARRKNKGGEMNNSLAFTTGFFSRGMWWDVYLFPSTYLFVYSPLPTFFVSDKKNVTCVQTSREKMFKLTQVNITWLIVSIFIVAPLSSSMLLEELSPGNWIFFIQFDFLNWRFLIFWEGF